MRRGVLSFAMSVLVIGASVAIYGADVLSQSQSGEIQLQLGHEFFREGRFADALEAYQKALKSRRPVDVRAARSGVIQSALRIAEFPTARTEAAKLLEESPEDPSVLVTMPMRLWSSGLFEEAEGRYRDALAKAPELARGLHGMARALAARSKLDDALTMAEAALRHAPRDLEMHHTVGSIFERMRRYEEAAARLHELREPAAEQGPQREGRLVAG